MDEYKATTGFQGIFLLQFYRSSDFSLRFFPKTGSGTISEISAIWLFIPFIIAGYLFFVARAEEYKKKKEQG